MHVDTCVTDDHDLTENYFQHTSDAALCQEQVMKLLSLIKISSSSSSLPPTSLKGLDYTV